jgi:predicted nucleic acid-binding protein
LYLIVDANILLGAVLGQSLPFLAEIASRDAVLLVPARMMLEARSVAADKRRVPLADALDRLAAAEAMVTVLDEAHYAYLEEMARERLEGSGLKDWPLLAASMALEAPIWTNDRDLFGTGVAVWHTRNIALWNPAEIRLDDGRR